MTPATEASLIALMAGHLCPIFRSMKIRQFLKLLQAHGATVVTGRGKGGHVLVTLNGPQSTVPTHGDTDFDPNFLDDICKQLGTRLKELNR
jgi:predicted RNA binding protein YcfA (HicA-like mRNA interferase family)